MSTWTTEEHLLIVEHLHLLAARAPVYLWLRARDDAHFANALYVKRCQVRRAPRRRAHKRRAGDARDPARGLQR